MRFPILAALLATVLLLASSALAAEPDDFQVLLRHSGLPQSVHLAPGQSLTPEKAQALWRGLVDGPANLRTFAPRTTLARLLREASATPLPYAELLARTARFRPLVVARPDGYCAVALTGTPISWLGQPTLQQGELYAEYFARYGAMNLEDQIREASRLTTHLMTLQGGAATVGPRLASATKLPVLTLSARGTLAVHEVAVPAGAVTAVVGAGATPVSIVLMAQGGNAGGSTPTWPPPPAGPGQWTQKAESMSDEARRFQYEMTGAPEGWVYRVRTGPGPKDFVDFDGFKDGVLLEVKGPGYKALLEKMQGKPWFEGLDEMLEQAKRQLKAAGSTPIRWHFAEQDVSALMRKLLKANRLDKRIEVLP
ncbi:restriction endonuclease fold toxin 5 of polymorphic toxin system [Archangium gephyra]|uniref:Hemagglutinin-related protein n=1 Tax=Archangium gephyra TaxID=48 RepID=A0AAC8TAZ7_9BACT|nr:Tox-REase-5 domain-containing protein [Archangium gephyra]AKI99112.1 Putative hemagglutinin-related protein [Archangium gephyra]REG31020.1 restriction endonuclease fold toxin 5 of polymorphic toxin system [Archangium gephyra]